jgi:DNA-binding IclR family transcriptional regulator
LALRLQSFLITINTALSLTYTLYNSLLHKHTSRLLVTDINTEIITSNRYEIFLSVRLQSLWNLGTQLKLFSGATGFVLYSRPTDNVENTVLLLHSADHTENTSHVIAKHYQGLTSLRLRGSVFTEPLLRSGVHNPVVPFFVRVLLRNGCFGGSTVLARSKYHAIPTSLRLAS